MQRVSLATVGDLHGDARDLKTRFGAFDTKTGEALAASALQAIAMTDGLEALMMKTGLDSTAPRATETGTRTQRGPGITLHS